MADIATGKITAKLLEEKLKKGWGTANFAADLGMSTEEFISVLEKAFYGPAAQNYRRRLKKNDKRIEQQLKRKACSTKTTIVKDISQEENEEHEAIIEENEEISKPSECEIAMARERELVNALMSIENNHKTEVAKRKSVFEEILRMKNSMLQLRKKLEECKEKADELLSKKAQIDENLERINKEKAETKSSLDKVREEIEKMRKVQVNVIDEIEIIPEGEYSIPEGWKEIRNSWFEDDEKFGSFTLNEISLLAKAILLKKAISEDGRKSEFVFVSDQMENLFKELS